MEGSLIMKSGNYIRARVDHVRGLEEGDLIQFCSKSIKRNWKAGEVEEPDMMTALVVNIPMFTGRYSNIFDVLIHDINEVRTISLSWNKVWKLTEEKNE